MKSDWLFDVLSDLQIFARANDLPILAEQLEETSIVALSEIASKLENTAAEKEISYFSIS